MASMQSLRSSNKTEPSVNINFILTLTEPVLSTRADFKTKTIRNIVIETNFPIMCHFGDLQSACPYRQWSFMKFGEKKAIETRILMKFVPLLKSIPGLSLVYTDKGFSPEKFSFRCKLSL